MSTGTSSARILLRLSKRTLGQLSYIGAKLFFSGNTPDSKIQANIDAMNEHHANVKSGLSFSLVSTDRTVSADWFDNANPDNEATQTAMKTKLRKGGAGDLNVRNFPLLTLSFEPNT